MISGRVSKNEAIKMRPCWSNELKSDGANIRSAANNFRTPTASLDGCDSFAFGLDTLAIVLPMKDRAEEELNLCGVPKKMIPIVELKTVPASLSRRELLRDSSSA